MGAVHFLQRAPVEITKKLQNIQETNVLKVKIGCLKLLKRTKLKTNSNAASGLQNPGFGAAGNPKTFTPDERDEPT